MKKALAKLVRQAGLKPAEIGKAIGVTRSAAHNKLAGRRPWTVEEVKTLARVLSARLQRVVTVDELLGATAPAPIPAAEASK